MVSRVLGRRGSRVRREVLAGDEDLPGLDRRGDRPAPMCGTAFDRDRTARSVRGDIEGERSVSHGRLYSFLRGSKEP